MKRALTALLVALAAWGPALPASAEDWGRFYTRGEYLLWWTKDSPAPVPLVSDGTLGPGTRIFLGGDDIDLGHRNGMRFTLGYWFTDDRAWGVEATGFYLPSVTERRSVAGSGAPGTTDLVIPFFDPTIPGEGFTFLSQAEAFSGTAKEELTSRLWGAEGNALRALSSQGPWRVELLGGFRYLKLGERYSFETNSPDLPLGSVNVFQTQDVFDASNDFYGGQLGLRGRYSSGRWTADATLKVALGAMRQKVDVAGALVTNQFSTGAVQTFAGGYFAQPTNMGSHARTVFAVVPEVGINVGFRLTRWASIVVGYTFLYASNVVRPGNQIDRTVNPTQSLSFGGPVSKSFEGEPRPRFKFDGSDFWAHGLNIGLGLSF